MLLLLHAFCKLLFHAPQTLHPTCSWSVSSCGAWTIRSSTPMGPKLYISHFDVPLNPDTWLNEATATDPV